MVYRQPFPGPGLGVRCLGAITRDRLEALRESDAILLSLIHIFKNGLVPPPPTNINVYKADPSVVKGFQSLPDSLHEACLLYTSSGSHWIPQCVPHALRRSATPA